nr:hypothetical protein [Rhizobium laguerreae]
MKLIDEIHDDVDAGLVDAHAVCQVQDQPGAGEICIPELAPLLHPRR